MNEFEEVAAHGALRTRRKSDNAKITIDWTVNITAIIAALVAILVFVVSTMTMWGGMDKRVVVLEEWKGSHYTTTVRIEKDLDDVKKVQVEDMKEIRRDIREILISKNRLPK